jgi:hypothetical protein
VGCGCEAGAAAFASVLTADFLFDSELTAAAVPAFAVTSGAIFLIVTADTPAFDNPSTDEYGRPAMIFFAVAGPTPGKLSKSFSLAVFKSIVAAVFCSLTALALEESAFV